MFFKTWVNDTIYRLDETSQRIVLQNVLSQSCSYSQSGKCAGVPHQACPSLIPSLVSFFFLTLSSFDFLVQRVSTYRMGHFIPFSVFHPHFPSMEPMERKIVPCWLHTSWKTSPNTLHPHPCIYCLRWMMWFRFWKDPVECGTWRMAWVGGRRSFLQWMVPFFSLFSTRTVHTIVPFTECCRYIDMTQWRQRRLVSFILFRFLSTGFQTCLQPTWWRIA